MPGMLPDYSSLLDRFRHSGTHVNVVFSDEQLSFRDLTYTGNALIPGPAFGCNKHPLNTSQSRHLVLVLADTANSAALKGKSRLISSKDAPLDYPSRNCDQVCPVEKVLHRSRTRIPRQRPWSAVLPVLDTALTREEKEDRKGPQQPVRNSNRIMKAGPSKNFRGQLHPAHRSSRTPYPKLYQQANLTSC